MSTTKNKTQINQSSKQNSPIHQLTFLGVQASARRVDVEPSHVGRLDGPSNAVCPVVGQADVVDVFLAERGVVDDLLVWLRDDVGGHLGRHGTGGLMDDGREQTEGEWGGIEGGVFIGGRTKQEC